MKREVAKVMNLHIMGALEQYILLQEIIGITTCAMCLLQDGILQSSDNKQSRSGMPNLSPFFLI